MSSTDLLFSENRCGQHRVVRLVRWLEKPVLLPVRQCIQRRIVPGTRGVKSKVTSVQTADKTSTRTATHIQYSPAMQPSACAQSVKSNVAVVAVRKKFGVRSVIVVVSVKRSPIAQTDGIFCKTTSVHAPVHRSPRSRWTNIKLGTHF